MIQSFVVLVVGYFQTLCLLLLAPTGAARRINNRRQTTKQISPASFLLISALLSSICAAYFFKYQWIVSRMSDLTNLSLALPPALASGAPLLLAIPAALLVVAIVFFVAHAAAYLGSPDPSRRDDIAAAMCYSFGGQAILAIAFFILVICAGIPSLPPKVMDVALRAVFIYPLVLPPLVVIPAAIGIPAFKKSQTKAARSTAIALLCLVSAALCSEIIWLGDGSIAEKLFPMPPLLRIKVIAGPLLKYNSDRLELKILAVNVSNKSLVLESAPQLSLTSGGKTIGVPMKTALRSFSIWPNSLAAGESRPFDFSATCPPEFNRAASIEASAAWAVYDPATGLTLWINAEKAPNVEYSISQ
jgi:hypothetical protein